MYKSLDFSVDELFPVFAQDVSELYGLRASAMAGLPLDLLAAGWACFLTATLAFAALCIAFLSASLTTSPPGSLCLASLSVPGSGYLLSQGSLVSLPVSL